MIKITSTRQTVHFVKSLVYGPAGIGKTCLSATAPTPIILSAESGLLALRKLDIPVIELNTSDDVMDAYSWAATSAEAKQYQTISLDSISEIGEVLLSDLKKKNKDPRKAYGEMNDTMSGLIRAFRDLPEKHVYFSAKQGKSVDDLTNITSYFPSMPGQTLIRALPYFFDEVLCMRIGKTDEGVEFRYLQTQPDTQHEAKDRSGSLNAIEKPDLTHIFSTITS